MRRKLATKEEIKQFLAVAEEAAREVNSWPAWKRIRGGIMPGGEGGESDGEKIRRLQMEVERLKADGACDACAGTGRPVSELPCMCGGTGRAADAVTHLRGRLSGTRAEIEKTLAETQRLHDQGLRWPTGHLIKRLSELLNDKA